MFWCQRGLMDAATSQTILARMPSVALLVDQGQVSWVSDSVAFGWPARVLERGTLSLLWHPEDRQQAIDWFQTTKTEWREQFGLRVVTGDGQVRWVDAQSGPGPGSSCLVILTDVTRVIQAEERIDHAESEVAQSATFAREVLFRTDGHQRLTWASASALRLLGWEPKELHGTVLAHLVHPHDRAFPVAQDVQVPTQPSTVRLRSKDGTYRWMSHQRCIAPQGEVVESFADVDLHLRQLHHWVDQAAKLEALLHGSPLSQVVLAPISKDEGHIVDFSIQWVSERALQFLAMTRNELIGSSLGAICGGLLDGLREYLQDALESDQETVVHQCKLSGVTVGERWIEVHACRVGDLLNLAWHDITDSRQALDQLGESERRYRLMADQVLDAVAWLRDGEIEWASTSVARRLGWLPHEWIGRGLDEFVHRDDLGIFHATVGGGGASSDDRGEISRRQFRIRAKDLEYHWVQAHARALTDDDADLLAVFLRIVDSEVAVLRELDHQARTDDLTGLLNRRAALAQITSLGSQSRRSGTQVALLLCDIDRFKEVNDRHGHAAGDQVLRVVSGRIGECIRTGDIAARLGGDEILVVLDGVHGISDAVDIAEKIRVAVSMPMSESAVASSCDGVDLLRVTLSIGVVLLESPGLIEDVIARADLAMYQAKRSGSDRVVCLPVLGPGRLFEVA